MKKNKNEKGNKEDNIRVNELIRQYDSETLEKLKKAELNILKDFIGVCEKYELNYFMIWGSALGTARHQGFIPWDDDLDIGMLREDYEKFIRVVEKELGENYVLSNPKTVKGYCGTIIKLQRKGTKFVPYISRTVKCDLCMHIDIVVFDNIDDNKKLAEKKVKMTRLLSQAIYLCGSPYPIIRIGGVVGFLARKTCYFAHYIFNIFRVSPAKLFDRFEKISKSANNYETKYISTYQSVAALKYKVKKSDIFPLRDMPFEDITVKMPHNYDKILTRTYGDYMTLPKEEDRVNHAAYIVDFGDGLILKDK